MRNQRDRLAAGMIVAVAEHGYNRATVAHVTAAAGVSRRTFYLYFASKQECYLSTYDLIDAHMHATARVAAAEHCQWSAKVRTVLGAMLEALAANPDLVWFCLATPPTADEKISRRHQLSIERLLGALADALPPALATARPTQAAEESLVGGIGTLIVRKVKAGEGSVLAELLPTVMELALQPYLGRQQAMRVAREKS